MINVQLYFLKLFGCMLCEAKAGGHEVTIDLTPFSNAILTGRPHPEVLLQFGKCDGTVGRSNLHCWKSEQGSILAAWLYELDSIAVSVIYSQAGRWDHKAEFWKPKLKRFKIGDFVYSRREGAFAADP